MSPEIARSTALRRHTAHHTHRRPVFAVVTLLTAAALFLIAPSGCMWYEQPTRQGRLTQTPPPAQALGRVYTSTAQDSTPRRVFAIGDEPVLLQVVDREQIPAGAACVLQVRPYYSTLPAYTAHWTHQRELDQTSIICRARRYADWRAIPDTYVFELWVDNTLASQFAFVMAEDPDSAEVQQALAAIMADTQAQPAAPQVSDSWDSDAEVVTSTSTPTRRAIPHRRVGSHMNR